jgi:hypothetical protein
MVHGHEPAALTHQVWAARNAWGAELRCAICKAHASYNEEDFEGMNRFVAEHKLCLDASA